MRVGRPQPQLSCCLCCCQWHKWFCVCNNTLSGGFFPSLPTTLSRADTLCGMLHTQNTRNHRWVKVERAGIVCAQQRASLVLRMPRSPPSPGPCPACAPLTARPSHFTIRAAVHVAIAAVVDVGLQSGAVNVCRRDCVGACLRWITTSAPFTTDAPVALLLPEGSTRTLAAVVAYWHYGTSRVRSVLGDEACTAAFGRCNVIVTRTSDTEVSPCGGVALRISNGGSICCPACRCVPRSLR